MTPPLDRRGVGQTPPLNRFWGEETFFFGKFFSVEKSVTTLPPSRPEGGEGGQTPSKKIFMFISDKVSDCVLFCCHNRSNVSDCLRCALASVEFSSISSQPQLKFFFTFPNFKNVLVDRFCRPTSSLVSDIGGTNKTVGTDFDVTCVQFFLSLVL
jgi:hypothetical protein